MTKTSPIVSTVNIRYAVAAILVALAFMMPAFASAANLKQASVRLGRLGNAAGPADNDVNVSFKLNTTPTSVAKIQIFFPSGFTLTAGSPTPTSVASTNQTPATTAVPNGGLTSTVVSSGAGAGGTITISGLTSASLNATALYGINIPAGSVTNPSTANQYNVSVSSLNASDGVIDTTPTPVYIYGATANRDQVVVSASVAPNFSFSLSSNTDTVPQVDPSAAQTSTGVTMTVGTNSPLGYTAYVKSKNAALTSASSGGSIGTGTFDGTVDSVPAGATKYGFVPTTGTTCSSCNGSITYDGEFSSGAGAFITNANQAGAFNGTNFASFVSRNGYTNADLIILKERASVANTVPYANDYTDTLTIVAAGNF